MKPGGPQTRQTRWPLRMRQAGPKGRLARETERGNLRGSRDDQSGLGRLHNQAIWLHVYRVARGDARLSTSTALPATAPGTVLRGSPSVLPPFPISSCICPHTGRSSLRCPVCGGACGQTRARPCRIPAPRQRLCDPLRRARARHRGETEARVRGSERALDDSSGTARGARAQCGSGRAGWLGARVHGSGSGPGGSGRACAERLRARAEAWGARARGGGRAHLSPPLPGRDAGTMAASVPPPRPVTHLLFDMDGLLLGG